LLPRPGSCWASTVPLVPCPPTATAFVPVLWAVCLFPCCGLASAFAASAAFACPSCSPLSLLAFCPRCSFLLCSPAVHPRLSVHRFRSLPCVLLYLPRFGSATPVRAPLVEREHTTQQ
jgi:hypothetical protein